MKAFFSTILIAALVLTAPLSASAAEGGDSLTIAGKRAKLVAKSALYGFAGGLVVGLASQVVKKKTRNIFIGGSLGLYAGIALGIYVISTSRGPAPYEGPDTYDDYGDYKGQRETIPTAELMAKKEPQQGLQLSVLNVNF